MTVYTVFKPGGTKDDEFVAYASLLTKSGIDIANEPRIPEPDTQNRWLYVWKRRSEAEQFAAALRASTHDESWGVHQFDDKRVSRTPIERIEIYLARQSDGITFRLQPESRLLIRTLFPHAALVSSVFVAFDTLQDFQDTHGAIWPQLALILTGLTEVQIKQLGGYRVYDPAAKEEMPCRQ